MLLKNKIVRRKKQDAYDDDDNDSKMLALENLYFRNNISHIQKRGEV